jgi:tetratricopeptide (TPR) repeat protein
MPLFALPLVASSSLGTVAAVARPGQRGSGQPPIPAKPGISGTVKDDSGAALPGVTISLTDQARSFSLATRTGEDGCYTFKSLPTGAYTVTAEAPGFERQSRSKVPLGGSRPVVVDFSLQKSRPDGARTAEAQSTGQKLGEFNYYDRPEYKAGSLNAASPASGYSAAAEADSYDLILAYVQGEGSVVAERSAARGRGTASPDAGNVEPLQPRAEASAEPGEASDAWNENQFFSQGSELLLHREFAPAAATFERAVARYPDSPKLQTGLGVAWFALAQYDRAVKALIRATELMPSDPRPYLLLGRAYSASSSENDEVTKRLEHLIELEPRNAQAHYYYALSLWKGERASQADLPQVEEHLKNAIALDPQMPEAHLELGALDAQQSRYPLAVQEYQAAIRLKPDLARAHYRLAQAYLRTGDKAAAQAELDAYQKLRRAQSDVQP